MSKTITFDEWVKKYTGKKINYDGAYGVQCVDLAKHYIKNVLGVEPQAIGNAKEYWNKRKTSQYLKDNFDFITPKFKDSEIQKGDIGVDTKTASGHGHIFIIDHCKNGELYYYDTNGDGKGAGLTLRHKAYNSTRINGILRPKNQKNINTVTPSKPATTKTESKPVVKNEKYSNGAESFNSKFKNGKTYKTTVNLRLRKDAGTDKNIIDVLPKGSKVTWYGYFTVVGKVTWKYVKTASGKVGFVSSEYLK